jgi:hypothetical protein
MFDSKFPNWRKGGPYGAGFVAAVLEGIEETLEEVIERVEISELRASLDVLQSRVTALRVSIEPREDRVDAERCEEPVAVER